MVADGEETQGEGEQKKGNRDRSTSERDSLSGEARQFLSNGTMDKEKSQFWGRKGGCEELTDWIDCPRRFSALLWCDADARTGGQVG